jgi:predicted ATPase
MAFPQAQILLFDAGRISRAQYDQLEHVRLVRQFLEDPRAFIEHL